MQIQSLIRPSQKPTRTVTVHGKAYVFSRTADDKFVAEVDDPKAIETLLKLPKAYLQYTPPKPPIARGAGGDDAAAAKAAKEAKEAEDKAAKEAAAAVAQQEANEKATEAAQQVDADVMALLSSTPQAIKKLIEKHTPSREVLEKALANEKAAERPRQQVVNLLDGTLSSLED
ncbi:hypothetical protein LJB71_08380 [Thermomonas sp. S9]|uniref:hypothetical protein n=1 Tax=Thermomonas sp. S9 TaxID=2885203 RepID=UPI00216AF34C|nr:hypothetical protein [Thermomonas sp. S9]MCR6496231.1 hypothetical protein [Thermomonas sp. S9]